MTIEAISDPYPQDHHAEFALEDSSSTDLYLTSRSALTFTIMINSCDKEISGFRCFQGILKNLISVQVFWLLGILESARVLKRTIAMGNIPKLNLFLSNSVC